MEGDEGGGVTVMSPARGRGGAPGAVALRAGRRCLLAVLAAVAAFPALAQAQSGSDRAAIIARTKQSVVAIGTYDRLRKPPFLFSGTGFAIEDGSVVATNAHVLPANVNAEHREALIVVLPNAGSSSDQFRAVKAVKVDKDRDVALLYLQGGKLPPLKLAAANRLPAEGQELLFTGFPIGTVLGFVPATHRAMVSALTPLAMPEPDSSKLDPARIKRLSGPPLTMIQLDAVSYPGNSGSPLYDAATGEVVGILNSTFVKQSREAAISQPSGISFAVPVQFVTEMLEDRR